MDSKDGPVIGGGII